jgi:hypothetical protein
MSQWSAVRVTHDVDIKVLVPDTDYATIRKKIREAFPDRARSHVPENPFIVAVNIDGVIVDFLLTIPGYEENIITRAVHRDLAEFTVWVSSAEDLIIQKIVADRGKDWLDVEALLIEQWGQLDEDYINSWLKEFADALESPEITEKYQEIFKKVANIAR